MERLMRDFEIELLGQRGKGVWKGGSSRGNKREFPPHASRVRAVFLFPSPNGGRLKFSGSMRFSTTAADFVTNTTDCHDNRIWDIRQVVFCENAFPFSLRLGPSLEARI